MFYAILFYDSIKCVVLMDKYAAFSFSASMTVGFTANWTWIKHPIHHMDPCGLTLVIVDQRKKVHKNCLQKSSSISFDCLENAVFNTLFRVLKCVVNSHQLPPDLLCRCIVYWSVKPVKQGILRLNKIQKHKMCRYESWNYALYVNLYLYTSEMRCSCSSRGLFFSTDNNVCVTNV